MPDPIDPRAVEAALGPPVAGPVVWAAEVTSTNDIVAARAREGAPEGLVIVADHQTAGRGRRGRAWEERAGDALLFSVLLRPPVPAARVGVLPVLVAVGVADGLAAAGTPVRIAWPNDLIIGDRKVGGILCELSADRDRVAWAVAGIGINVAGVPELPEGRWVPAALAEAGAVSRQDVLVAVLGGLSRRLAGWYRDPDTDVAAAFAPFDALLGRVVHVAGAAGEVAGTAAGLTAEGALRIRGTDGAEQVVSAGEVTGVDPAA